MPTILVVDDEKNIRGGVARGLQLEGFTVLEAGDGEAALALLEREDVDALLLDLQMPKLDGMAVLEALARAGRRIPAVVLSAHGTVERAVRAVRLGAFDFIEKPPAIERIVLALRNALRVERLERENLRLAEEAGLGGAMLGDSPALRALREVIARVGPTDAGVLLTGENGSGKELAARALHAASGRAARPLVTVNCAAIPETLFESELFGHARGAFTGATEARRGKFQEADGGTLFLDEVGEVPLALQPKMLRALESGEIERVGGRAERVDVRVIAASNRDLEAETKAGRFRQDLYYRLLVVPVRVPPLRERREDIAELARHFLALACRQARLAPRELAPAALARLERHAWPGNVRELRNAMQRVAILAPGRVVGPEDLAFLEPAAAGPENAPSAPAAPAPASASAPPGRFDLAAELEKHERAIVLAVLERTRWRMSRAAEELGLERSHLYRKLKALGIDRPPE